MRGIVEAHGGRLWLQSTLGVKPVASRGAGRRALHGTLRETTRAVLPLLVNPRAGGPGVPVDSIQAALETVGVSVRVEAIQPAFDDALRALVAAGEPVIGVAGGDGSARAAARILAGSSSALAMFPIGTLNHFSRSLGIATIEDAARAVAGGRVADVAVGDVDGEPFLNTATFGLYADVVRRRERLRRCLGKWPAALAAFLVTTARYRPLQVTLGVDGQQLRRATALVGVGIGRRSFPVTTVPSRLGTEPELVLSILRPRSPARLFVAGLRTAGRMLTGRAGDEERDVELVRTDAFTLASPSSRLGVTLDGEIVRTGNQARVTLRHDALRVVVPG